MEARLKIQRNAEETQDAVKSLRLWANQQRAKDRILSGVDISNSGAAKAVSQASVSDTGVSAEQSNHLGNVTPGFVSASLPAARRSDWEAKSASPAQANGKLTKSGGGIEPATSSGQQDIHSAAKRNPGRTGPSATKGLPAGDKSSTASLLQDEGNQAYKKGNYLQAKEAYTRSLRAQRSAVVLANRAMVALKLASPAEAEADCTAALQLDPALLKAWQRRSAARKQLGSFWEAAEDCEEALRLEPGSKALAAERAACVALWQAQAGLSPPATQQWASIPITPSIGMNGRRPALTKSTVPDGESMKPSYDQHPTTSTRSREVPGSTSLASSQSGTGNKQSREANQPEQIPSPTSKKSDEGPNSDGRADRKQRQPEQSSAGIPGQTAASAGGEKDKSVQHTLSMAEQQQPVREPSRIASTQHRSSAQHAQIPDEQKVSPDPITSTSKDDGSSIGKRLHAAKTSAPGEGCQRASTENSSHAKHVTQVAGLQKQPETGSQGRRAAPLDDQVLAELAAAGVTTVGQRAPREAAAVGTLQAPGIRIPLQQRTPQSGIEFETAWRGLRGDVAAQADYLKLLDPAALPGIFKQSLTGPLLASITIATLTDLMRTGDGSRVALLCNLTTVPRFSMAALSIGKQDRSRITPLWDEVVQATEEEALRNELQAVRVKYRL